jgi:uncharacterized protein YdhG (YjbR/CyaY superfamily)
MAIQKTATSNAKSGVVDEYLASVPEDVRATLEKLRKTIRAAAPESVEVLSYQMPTIKVDGRAIMSFGAFKNHCSVFPMSYAFIRAHEEELKPFYKSKGTIRFTVAKPLPAALVKKLVKMRIKENEERAQARAAKKRK